jgi:hypothetical protein
MENKEKFDKFDVIITEISSKVHGNLQQIFDDIFGEDTVIIT